MTELINNKQALIYHAKVHTEMVERIYVKEVEEVVKNSKVYSTDFKCSKDERPTYDTEIILEDSDTVSSAFKYKDEGKVAVLNFASFKDPGGLFFDGSTAQEECLCHESILYNVLREFMDYYMWNRGHLNGGLYLNRGIYSPNVLFLKNDISFNADVITVAAPNAIRMVRYKAISKETNTFALKDRIKYVLDIAKENKVDTLILGAYGCGVFKQNPFEVASVFKEYLTEYEYKCFRKVIFAIPLKGKSKNYYAFMEVLKDVIKF